MAITKVKLQVAPKRVTILGSTGSVGTSTVDLLKRDLENYDVEALTANHNIDLLAKQAVELGARLAVVADPDAYGDLKEALSGTGIETAAGKTAVVEAATRPAEWVMAAIVGTTGLEPTLAAVRRGAVVALANKESLVCSGSLLIDEVKRAGATLLPVDSEHNAIYQMFDFKRSEQVEKIILTASGGPFREKSLDEMRNVTVEQAISHPNWRMGAKISVDSATMMNKGLELIEASHLFPVDESCIEILVHPQSIVHGMVAYQDGSVLAQMGTPDMRTPIAYSLAWPDRMATQVDRLNLADIGNLAFQKPDVIRFPALRLARDVLQSGGAAPTILNASNEEAVLGFLNGRCGFLDIAWLVEMVLEAASPIQQLSSLDEVKRADTWARHMTVEMMKQSKK